MSKTLDQARERLANSTGYETENAYTALAPIDCAQAQAAALIAIAEQLERLGNKLDEITDGDCYFGVYVHAL